MGVTRIVTDSTADLDAELVAEHGIIVIPMLVHFGDEEHTDGVTIDSRTFFARMAASHTLPTTSQPTPGAIEAAYRRALAGADGLVAIHVSAKLSGTYSTATRVAAEIRQSGVMAPIEVIDSAQGSLGMQFALLAAARAARDGADVSTTAAIARDTLARTELFLVVDDLVYLERGGRIGAAKRVVGSLLNVKPLITLRDGAVVALESPRTRRRAYERIAENVRDMAPIESVIVGQTSEDVGDQLEAAVRAVYSGPIRRAWAGPTIGSHVGPGAAGVAMLRAHR